MARSKCLVAFVGAIALAGAAIIHASATSKGVSLGLFLTGRWSFIWFWLAYVRLPSRAPRREFGLAYASAHVVHVGLVIWFYQIADPPPPRSTLVFFGIAVIFTYWLAALSFKPTSDLAGLTITRLSRLFCMNYILMAFGYDLVLGAIRSKTMAEVVAYAPFATLIIAAPIINLVARSPQRAPIRLPY